jgi:purine-binding chemotaxis protein CheW
MKENDRTDWPEIHRRIDSVRAAIERGFVPGPDEERRILKTRAQKLGQEPIRDVAAEETLDVVEFDLANERYGFPLRNVREVSLLRELTPVPCTPDFVLGIINLRGEIRTVIDLKKFFDLPHSGITELNKIILLQQDHVQLGILADAITGVRRLRLDELQPALPTLTGIGADYLRGITNDRLIVLDPLKILSDKRILVDEEVPT